MARVLGVFSTWWIVLVPAVEACMCIISVLSGVIIGWGPLENTALLFVQPCLNGAVAQRCSIKQWVLHKGIKTKADVLLIVFFPPLTPQVFPSQDPLDRADFNAVEYINTLFPTEQVSCAHSTSLSSAWRVTWLKACLNLHLSFFF